MTPESLDRDARLDQLLAEYLHAAEAGRAPDREAFLARHPEFADELRSFIDNRAHIERLAAPLAGAALEATIGLGEGGGDGSRVRYFGEYELLAELGRGGMGVVYKARQSTLQRFVALKMILSGDAASADDLLRFKQEAEAAATLDHPHIAPIYETGEHEGRRYFSMKLIDGGTLREQLQSRRGDTRGGVKLLAQVARAVHHAHQRGVLHRDLKPSNVLLDEKGESYVTDFGLAKRVEGGSDVTRTGAIVGTPAYMAPEQAMGEKQLTTAVDVYSLGAMLYELLTGAPPFQAASPMETLMQVISREPTPPRARERRVDRDLETICLKCLEKDPTRRYDSAAAFADELDRWLAGEPITARPVGGLERARRWCRRNPLVASLLALLAASLVGGAAVSSLYAMQANEQRQLAEQAERTAKQNLYDAHMNLAQIAWENHQAQRSRELLKPYEDKSGSKLRSWEWHYQNRLNQGELRKHNLNQLGAAISPDGTRVASFNWATVDLWNFADGKESAEFAAGKFSSSSLNSVAWHPDGRRLAVSNGSFTQFNNKKLIGEVQLLDATNGAVLRSFAAESGILFTCARFSPDGKRLAAGRSEDTAGRSAGAVRIWNTETGTEERTLSHGGAIRDLAFSPDGKRLISACYFKLKVWDAESGEELQELPAERIERSVIHYRVCQSAAYSPDGSRVVAGFFDGTISAWDVEESGKLRPRAAPPAQSASVNWVAFSPDGKTFATAGGDQTLRLWDAESGALRRVIPGAQSALLFTAFSRDGSRILAGENGGYVKIWAVEEDGDGCRVLRGHAGQVLSLAFSPDGKTLASGSNAPLEGIVRQKPIAFDSLKLWDPISERELRTIPRPAHVGELEFTPEGSRLLAAGWKQLDVWDVAASREAPPIPVGIDNHVFAISVSPDGKFYAVGSPHGAVKLFSAADGSEVRTLRKEGYMTYDLAFHPDGKTLAAGISDQTVLIYDVATGDQLKSIRAQADCVAFSPDGKRFAAKDPLQLIIHLFDPQTGESKMQLHGHTANVSALAFSPDGRRLVSGGEDKMIKVWDLATGQEVRTLTGHPDRIRKIAFSPDGKILATAGGDSLIRLWDARPVTPEFAAESEALAVMRTLRRQTKSEAEALAALRENPTVSDAVKAKAAELFDETAP